MRRLTFDAVLLQSLITPGEPIAVAQLAPLFGGGLTGAARVGNAADILRSWRRVQLDRISPRALPTHIISMDDPDHPWMQLSALMVRFVLIAETHIERARSATMELNR